VIRLRVIALLALCFSTVAPCFADSLQVSFWSHFDNVILVEDISGSFLWDTAAQTFSNISVTSNMISCLDGCGPYIILPEIATTASSFVGPNDLLGRPAGSILFLGFPDANGTGGFTFNYTVHGPLDTPVEPIPGTYSGLDLFLIEQDQGIVGATSGQVIVTETSEPASLYLLGFVSLTLLSVLASKRLIRAH